MGEVEADTTPTLTEFLLARVAEDEAEARQLGDASARAERLRLYGDRASGEVVVAPSRVLAECEAKQRRLAIADDLEAEADDDTYGWAHSVAEQIRRIEALPYADHPDYREEWRP